MVLHCLLCSVASNIHVLATVTPELADIVMFGMFFGLALVMFIAAVARQTFLTAIFSGVLWLALSFAVWNFGEATSGLTAGSSYAFLGLGGMMMVLSVYFAFKLMKQATKAKEDAMVEGDVL